MGHWLPTVKTEVTFDGDTVRFELRRLKVRDALSMQSMEDKTGAEAEQIVKRILDEYVVRAEGVCRPDGTAVPQAELIELMATEAYFSPLLQHVIVALAKGGQLGAVDAGN